MNDFAAHVNRIPPTLPPGAMQTFEVDAPLATHWRAATCEEVECAAWMQGWTTDVPSDHPDEIRMLKAYEKEIRSGGITATTTPEGLMRYSFPAGTPCFRRIYHRLPLERDAIFTVRSGDHRGTDGVICQYNNGAEWVDAFANHQSKISDLVNRG